MPSGCHPPATKERGHRATHSKSKPDKLCMHTERGFSFIQQRKHQCWSLYVHGNQMADYSMFWKIRTAKLQHPERHLITSLWLWSNPSIHIKTKRHHNEQAAFILWVHLILWLEKKIKNPHMRFEELWNVTRLSTENTSAVEWSNLKTRACWMKIRVHVWNILNSYSLFTVSIILLSSKVSNSIKRSCRRPNQYSTWINNLAQKS